MMREALYEGILYKVSGKFKYMHFRYIDEIFFIERCNLINSVIKHDRNNFNIKYNISF